MTPVLRYQVRDVNGTLQAEYDTAEEAECLAEQYLGWHVVEGPPDFQAFVEACLDCRTPDELWDFVCNNAPELFEDDATTPT